MKMRELLKGVKVDEVQASVELVPEAESQCRTKPCMVPVSLQHTASRTEATDLITNNIRTEQCDVNNP